MHDSRRRRGAVREELSGRPAVLASETFHGDTQTYGWLTSALGVGAVIGALITGATERVSGWRLLLAGFGLAFTNAMIAVSPWLWLALSTVLLMGGEPHVQYAVEDPSATAHRTDDARTRMALHGLVFLGTTPIGMPLLGWVCAQWGPQAGLGVASLTALVAAVSVTLILHRLRGNHDAGPSACETFSGGPRHVTTQILMDVSTIM